MTVKEILRDTSFNSRISPLDREILLFLAMNKPKEYILAHPEKKLTQTQIEKLKKYVERRTNGEPIAYLTNKKEFFGLEFLVNRNVLIPRPETELLVEAVLRTIMNKKFKIRNFIDLGAGSGNIVISVIKNLPASIKRKIDFYASDISGNALVLARKNARKHKLYKEINFKKSDLLHFISGNKSSLKGNILIAANLPYLDKKWKNLLESSESKSLQFEPKMALKGGYDGLDGYRRLAKQTKRLGASKKDYNIYIFCEIGHFQKNEIKNIFSFSKKINFFKDLAGKWRMAEIEI